MADTVKGTVTSLSSYFPAEEAHKAAKRVEGAIGERQSEADRLLQFIADNNALVNLVHRLPDEISHDIMVPFGRGAFFPGRLIHTNEFMVLLGAGYYAEQTAKQTMDILQRRGKALESQVDSLKAMIADMQAESSFFKTAAIEADEGIVEIREDYIDEPYMDNKPEPIRPEKVREDSSASTVKKVVEDEEFARIMSRLDELEKEEQAAIDSNKDEDEMKPNICCLPSGRSDSNIADTSQRNDSTVPRVPSSCKRVTWADQIPVSHTHTEEKIPEVSALKIQDPSVNGEGHQVSELKAQYGKNIVGSIVERNQHVSFSPVSSSAQIMESGTMRPVSRFKMQRSRPGMGSNE